MKRNTAFTLIELLIVVAIIAILAAIAVPNFLEAQTRAKVSAGKAALRTMATALESYAVDNVKYPYALMLPGQPWLPPGGPADGDIRAGGLTSPISYLTSLPIDPFEHPINSGIRIKAPVYYERAGFVVEGTPGSLTVNRNRPSMVPADAVGQYQNLTGTGADTPVTSPELTPTRWVLYSLGPDIDFRIFDDSGNLLSNSRYNLHNRYDPTNGTVSQGNVLRFPGGTSFP